MSENPANQASLQPPAALMEFQRLYSHHLRSLGEDTLPSGIPARRSRVYEELLFNNICSFINKCFPVAKKMLTAVEWRELSRQFYRDWQCHTPYFGRIPFEFVQFVQQLDTPSLPQWLGELLDYEWRELEVDLHPATVPRVQLPIGDEYRLLLNPTLQNLQYHWPVQRIGPDFVPDEMQPTFLLVYRGFDHQVRFVEVNGLSCLMLQLLSTDAADAKTPQTLLLELADATPQLNLQTLLDFGKPLLWSLLEQNIVLAVETP